MKLGRPVIKILKVLKKLNKLNLNDKLLSVLAPREFMFIGLAVNEKPITEIAVEMSIGLGMAYTIARRIKKKAADIIKENK